MFRYYSDYDAKKDYDKGYRDGQYGHRDYDYDKYRDREKDRAYFQGQEDAERIRREQAEERRREEEAQEQQARRRREEERRYYAQQEEEINRQRQQEEEEENSIPEPNVENNNST